ncbi:AAA family ATPase [Nocardia sp. GCM10030253]|uniref:MinD/ParA family ATP-binding protein n=1 Tax=Nocardia sp. GCM10030253 TaxID=3273404 RepID=UPI003645289D
MNRAPSTNGHSTESVRGRGGYDAYFSQTGELTAPPPTPGPTVDGSASQEAFKYGNFADPVVGAPQQPQESTSAAADDRAHGAVTPPSATSAQPRQAVPSTPPTPAREAAPAQSAPTTSTSTESTNTESYSQAVTRSEAVPDTSGAGQVWQPAAQTAQWVPDRIDRTSYEATPRVEVLPATLTSIDLLADISAARRAQLRSQAGMRGALNKVGFKLGLSPAEQRAEDRRTRIRRQLTTTYQIAVVSVKGGVGRTTAAATLGSTFASLRPDRVVAIDANPDFGDLATRTSRHPFGLTLRDLAQSTNLEAFSAVQSFTSINDADLAVIASPWTTEANEALSGREYATAVEVLRKHYNLLLVDCGTGVLDSATAAVLQTSDAVVVVTPATVGGVTGAVATLNWLSSHGLQHLIAKSIVAITHHQPAKPTVDVEAIEKLFATAQRPTCVVPYDEHLAEGGEIDLRLLDKDTLLAFEELAAWLSDSFPGYLSGAGADSGDRGGWL